jgi:flagellin FlaB
MNTKLNRLMKDESGITALETAIILIAFVVVAAIFAFTILSTGTFLTERSKEAAYAGLQEVRGSMELKGSVIAQMTTSTNTVDSLVFTLSNVAGGQPVNLVPSGASRVVDITYRDKDQVLDLNTGDDWTVRWVVSKQTPADDILEAGELAEITADVSGLTTALGADTTFVLELKPQQGAVLNIERTTPARIDTVTDLH